jgi:hypothetical protein
MKKSKNAPRTVKTAILLIKIKELNKQLSKTKN